MVLALLLRFDRTYEGLKRGLSCARGRGAYRFDRTYEGLKRASRPQGGPGGHSVLTVPMRV